MAFVEEKQFRYPAEEECLVRRLGSAVITAWPHLPRDVQEKIFDEAKKREESDKLVRLLAEQKAARDARYAARKGRQKKR